MSLRNAVVLIALIFIAATLGAETVMIAARETIDGAQSPPPLTTVEGVSGGLFEAGHVVFDAGAIRPDARTADLEAVAREGQAGWLLQITVAYTQTKIADDTVRVACSAAFSLVNTSTGETSLSDKVSGTNAGKEKVLSRAELGVELGKLISQRVVKALPTPAL